MNSHKYLSPFFVCSDGKKISDQIGLNLFSTDQVSIFESLRTYGGKIFHEEDHLKRFLESAKTAGLAGIDKEKLHRELQTALDAYQKERHPTGDLFLRITLIQNQIWVLVGERRHAKSLYEKGVRLKTSPVRRSLSNAAPPEAKTSAYHNAFLAALEPRPEGIYEWLFLDREGYVTEVSIGNLFIVRTQAAKELWTPPEPGILNGVTRRFVIKCARCLGIPVKEVPLMRHDVYQAPEAFLTNTSWEILPVAELDGRSLRQTVPGPMTRKLQSYFRQQVQKEIGKAS